MPEEMQTNSEFFFLWVGASGHRSSEPPAVIRWSLRPLFIRAHHSLELTDNHHPNIRLNL